MNITTEMANGSLDVMQCFLALLNMSEKSFKELLAIRDAMPLPYNTELALLMLMKMAED